MISRNLSILLKLNFFWKNLKLIFVLIIKLTSFLKSLRKRNATLCAILDMKLFNTDIIDTVADDKKLLIQGWCFKKSLSTVPKREIYVFQRCVTLRAHDVTLNLVKFVYFSVLVLDRNITIPTFDCCESSF